MWHDSEAKSPCRYEHSAVSYTVHAQEHTHACFYTDRPQRVAWQERAECTVVVRAHCVHCRVTHTYSLAKQLACKVFVCVRVCLQVVTSDLPGADFKGTVHVQLNGWYGSTAELALTEAKTGARVVSYKRGATTAFNVQLEDRGPLSSIQVSVLA